MEKSYYFIPNGMTLNQRNKYYLLLTSQESQTNLYLCKNAQAKEKEKAGNQMNFFLQNDYRCICD